jgi:hypothetical protein
MDPNETLRLLRLTISQALVDEDPGVQTAHLGEIAEYFRALDEWLSRGGFAPKAWQLLDVQWRDVVGGPPEPLGGPVPTLADGSPLPVEPLGGPVPGVDGAHLPDVGTWTGDPGTPEYKAETERRIDRYLGRNPDE